MTRPLIYKIFTRGILALLAAQLAHHFLPDDWPMRRFGNLSLLLGGLFALCSLLAWLRIDGLAIPQMKLPRMKRKDPGFLKSDLADHLDEEPILFDDLGPEEQNTCVFLADLALTAGCLIISIFV